MPEPTQHWFWSANNSSDFGSATGRFFIKTAFTRVKIAAFAPMPKASVSSAVAVNAGVFLNCLTAKRESWMNPLILFSLLVPQRHHGIHFRRAARGDETCQCRCRKND